MGLLILTNQIRCLVFLDVIFQFDNLIQQILHATKLKLIISYLYICNQSNKLSYYNNLNKVKYTGSQFRNQQENMGQSQNTLLNITYDHKSMPIELYKIVQVQKNGNVLLKHKKSGDQFLLRTFTSYEEDQTTGFSKLLRKRQKIQCSHLLRISEIHRRQQKNMCSVLQKIFILIQYPFKSLKEEVTQRSNNKPGPRYFNESQILSILYSCCIALKTLYKNNFTHEALSLQEIMIDRTGLIKISDPILLGKQKNYIYCMKNIDLKLDEQMKQTIEAQRKKDKFFTQDEQNKYYHLSPEIMNFLDDFNFFYYEKERSDVFILGCLILEACLLRKFQLYNAQAKRESLSIIPLLIKQLRLRSVSKQKGYSQYSQFFLDILSGMLNLEPKSRPTFSEIIQQIEQFNEASTTLIEQLKTVDKKPRYSQNPRNYINSAAIPYVQNSGSLPLSSIPHQISGQRFINTSNYKGIQQGFGNSGYKNDPKITQFAIETSVKRFRGFKKPSSTYKNQRHSESLTNQNSSRKGIYNNSFKINQNSHNMNFNESNWAYNGYGHNLRDRNSYQNQTPQMVNIGSIQINFNHNNLPLHNESAKNNNHVRSFTSAQKRIQSSFQKKSQFTPVNRYVSNDPVSYNHHYSSFHNEGHINKPKKPLFSQDIPEISALLAKINVQKHLQTRLSEGYKHQSILTRLSNQKAEQKTTFPSNKYYQGQYNQFRTQKHQQQHNQQEQHEQPHNKVDKLLQKRGKNKSTKSYQKSNSNASLTNQNPKSTHSNKSNFEQNIKIKIPKQFTVTDKMQRTLSNEQLVENDIRTPVMSIYQSKNLNKSSELLKNLPLSIGSLEISRSNLPSEQKTIQKSKKSYSPQREQSTPNLSQKNSNIISQEPVFKQSSYFQLQKKLLLFRQKQQPENIKFQNKSQSPKKISQMTEKQLDQMEIIDAQSINMRQLSSSGASVLTPTLKYINHHESIKEVNQEHQGMMQSSSDFSRTVSNQFKKNKNSSELEENSGIQTQQNQSSLKLKEKTRSPDKASNSQKQLSYNYSQSDNDNRLEMVSPSFAINQNYSKKLLNPIGQIQKGSFPKKILNLSKISTNQHQNCNFVIENLQGGGKYQGFQLDGKKHGQGRLFFKDGGYYQGQWQDNKMTGFGKLFYDSGNIAYEGFWFQDQFCGKGRVFNDRPQQFQGSFQGLDFTQLLDKWIFYQGQFQGDAKHGKGRIKLTNGEVFDGTFIQDVIEGEGCFYKIDGSILEGYWKQNIYIGKTGQS